MNLETIAIHVGYDGDPTTMRLPFPSTKPLPLSLIVPSMARHYSILKLPETFTRGSGIQPILSSKNESLRLRAA